MRKHALKPWLEEAGCEGLASWRYVFIRPRGSPVRAACALSHSPAWAAVALRGPQAAIPRRAGRGLRRVFRRGRKAAAGRRRVSGVLSEACGMCGPRSCGRTSRRGIRGAGRRGTERFHCLQRRLAAAAGGRGHGLADGFACGPQRQLPHAGEPRQLALHLCRTVNAAAPARERAAPGPGVGPRASSCGAGRSCAPCGSPTEGRATIASMPH